MRDMRLVRRVVLLALAPAVVLAVGACGSSEPEPERSSPPLPSVVVDPLGSIQGAERMDVDGVGIDVAPGFVAERFVRQEGATTVLRISAESDPDISVLVLTVTRNDPPVTDADVNLSLYLQRQQTIGQRDVTDVVDTQVVWSGFPDGSGFDAVESAAGEPYDLRAIMTRDDTGERLIGVQVWSLPDRLEGSDGWQMARTVRADD